MKKAGSLIRVAVPVPLADGFDYLWDGEAAAPLPGTRVEVPFGRGHRIGIVLEHPAESGLPPEKLKAARRALDPEPLLGPELLGTLRWAADYYQHPIGEVLSHALPGLLRKGRPVEAARGPTYRLTDAGAAQAADALRKKAARQADVLEYLATGARSIAELRRTGATAATLRRLVELGWIEAVPDCARAGSASAPQRPTPALAASIAPAFAPPPLTDDQRNALERIRENGKPAGACLLYGVTGSGKTEVFLRLVAE